MHTHRVSPRRLGYWHNRTTMLAMVAFVATSAMAAPPRPIVTAASQPARGPAIEGLFISPQISLDPPQGLLLDAWYKLELLNQSVGYMRTAVRRQSDRIETLDYTLIEVARGPVTIKVAMKNLTVESIDGKPLEIHTEQVFASQPVRYDATFAADGSIDLQITQSDNKVTRHLPADPTATFPWQMTREILAGKRKGGETFSERGYAFVSDTKPMTVEHEAAGEAPLRLPSGRQVQTYRYKVVQPGMSGVGDVYCEGRLLVPLRFDMPVMTMHFTATIATKEQATAMADKPTELFVSTLLKAKVTRPLDPAQASSVLYSLQLPDAKESVNLLTTEMQRILPRKQAGLQVLISRRKADTVRPAPTPARADLDKYLASTTYCNIDDEAVRKMAAEGAAGEKDPQRLAEKLTRFVYQKMTHKGLDVAFATASEVARTLQGDCTEHATLLAALARANGLPARGVFGMVAMPGSYADGEMTFGYHMWTQVYVGGRWIDIDAALNQPLPDATHIALGLSDLADTSLPMESVQTFMQMAGKVQLTAEPRK